MCLEFLVYILFFLDSTILEILQHFEMWMIIMFPTFIVELGKLARKWSSWYWSAYVQDSAWVGHLSGGSGEKSTSDSFSLLAESTLLRVHLSS